MKHFAQISSADRARLFYREPVELSVDSHPSLLAVALGATLYTPANRSTLLRDVKRQYKKGCTSMVLCLEDSIPDADVPLAEDNIVELLHELHGEKHKVPLLFIRVRTPEQMISIGQRAGAALSTISGFAIPKFHHEGGRGQAFIDALHIVQDTYAADGESHRRLRIMPILESSAVIHLESRTQALSDIASLLRDNRDDILSVRVGATDMASAFGLRRSRDLTIYDVKVVSNIIGDIVNILGRPEDELVISGPVWEHFTNTERVLRPQLRVTPFARPAERKLRSHLMDANLDTLIREIELDLANGLLGKTIIHPSHVAVVNALNVVSHEEFLDASAIAGNVSGGAAASPYGNKMNEMKPHQGWAKRTLLRAQAYGVSAPEITFVDLLEATMNWSESEE